jgi:amino acid transporter
MLVSFAELGSALPFNGGAYIYLQHVYGPIVGFLFSWTTVFILKPAPVAIISLIFGDYVNRILFSWLEPAELAAQWSQKGAALFCVWTIICVQAITPRYLPTINTVFTIIKLAAVSSIACIGLSLLGSSDSCFTF